MFDRLCGIFFRAAEFHRLVCSQQACLEISMLESSEDGSLRMFNPAQMELVNGGMEHELALAGTPIEVSVFPSVIKRDNESSAAVRLYFFAVM